MTVNVPPGSNVVAFPTPNFTLLNGCSDGWFVLFSFGDVPVETIGGFTGVADALAWAIENGKREQVHVDETSFLRCGEA